LRKTTGDKIEGGVKYKLFASKNEVPVITGKLSITFYKLKL